MINLDKYPQFLSAADLVELGLYLSKDAAYMARQRGTSPDYFQVKGKVLYPKQAVIEFINKGMKKGFSSESNDQDTSQ